MAKTVNLSSIQPERLLWTTTTLFQIFEKILNIGTGDLCDPHTDFAHGS